MFTAPFDISRRGTMLCDRTASGLSRNKDYQCMMFAV